MRIIEHSHLTEKSIRNVELRNELVFIVIKKATKEEIKEAIEKEYEVKVDKINVCIDRKGRKKAFVKLNEKYHALDIATKLGMM